MEQQHTGQTDPHEQQGQQAGADQQQHSHETAAPGTGPAEGTASDTTADEAAEGQEGTDDLEEE